MLRRPTSSKEVSKSKAMCRAGEVTKPAYVRFCNQIHLLDLQAKGGKGREEASKARQYLISDLVGGNATN